MRLRSTPLLALYPFVLAFACAQAVFAQSPERPIPYPLPESAQWQKAVKAGTRTDTGRPGPKYWTNYARYKIRATLDPATAKVRGHIDMTYVNRSPRAVRELRVHLRQNLYKGGNIRNRYVEITGGVTVSNVTFGGEPVEVARGRRGRGYSIRGTVMTLRLSRRIRAGAEATLSMDWEYRVPTAGRKATANGWSVVRQGQEDNNVFYLGYWYPQFAVKDDVAGWVSQQYMSNAEFYMGYADYDLEFTAPKGFLVTATGELQNPEEVLPKAAVERLAAAAEGREIVHVVTPEDLAAGRVTRMDRDVLTWRFVAKQVRDIAVSASDQYIWDATHAVVKDRDGAGVDGKCMIHSVYKPRRGGADTKCADWARHTVEYMSKQISPYPWPHMTCCEGVIGGGMEFPMMTIIGRFNHGTVAHEIIHMWFPMIVGSNEKAHAWQDEGFTSFFTNLCRVDYRGGVPNERARRGGFLRTAASGGVPLMRHGDMHGEGRGVYGFNSYTKTSMLLSQLRGVIGDELFFRGMGEYAADWAYKHPTPRDFFRTMSRVVGEDLDWYFRIWWYETWSLDQAVASVEETATGTTVVIEDVGLATHPTEVAVEYADGEKETRKLDVRPFLAGQRQQALTFKKGVRRVVIDPRRVTLDTSRGNNIWVKE